jgi:hypothetical protein
MLHHSNAFVGMGEVRLDPDELKPWPHAGTIMTRSNPHGTQYLRHKPGPIVSGDIH